MCTAARSIDVLHFFTSQLFLPNTNQCSFLQERPNPLALARLLRLERRVGETALNAITNVDTNVAVTSNGRPRTDDARPRHSWVMNLSACRLMDHELQILLHALSDGRAAASTIAPSVEAQDSRAADGTVAKGSSMPVSALLLNGNPGIGVGGLRSLCGGAGIGKRGSPMRPFPYLLRLELSGCGLTVADLAGLAWSSSSSSALVSGQELYTEGGGVDDEPLSYNPTSSTASCLQTLVLRDNPLTRVGIVRAGEGAHIMKLARQGATALGDFIARASALETLDVSGGWLGEPDPFSLLYHPPRPTLWGMPGLL